VAGPQPVTPRPYALHPISTVEIDSAVALHRAALGYSINSRLGGGHLAYLYTVMRGESDCLATVAVASGELLGVVSAALDPEGLTRRLFAGLPAIRWFAILSHLACHPGIWMEWVESRSLTHPVMFQGMEIKACLTAIVVSPAARRFGVGRALVGAVDDFMRRHDQPYYRLDTRADNSVSRSFYRNLGFIELEERGRDVIYVRQL
jgi:ribosomal protein S18 acetylase RimI-like enzyme